MKVEFREKTPVEKVQKKVDNVKIVNHPINGTVYVCPYPASHFPDLQAEAQRIRFRKFPKQDFK